MFEEATKKKFRFETQQGQISVEDLWDLPLQSAKGVSLDSVAIGLNKQIKALGEESFVSAAPAGSPLLKLKLDIVKHIIADKVAERDARAKAAEQKQLKDKIAGIIAQKQDEELSSKSLEELQALLKA